MTLSSMEMAPPFSFLTLSISLPHTKIFLPHRNYSVCLHFVECFLFLSTTLKLSLLFNSIFFSSSLHLFVSTVWNHKNHVINRCARMIESSSSVFFFFCFFSWMKSNPISSILKNLQTPKTNAAFIIIIISNACLSNTSSH